MTHSSFKLVFYQPSNKLLILGPDSQEHKLGDMSVPKTIMVTDWSVWGCMPTPRRRRVGMGSQCRRVGSRLLKKTKHCYQIKKNGWLWTIATKEHYNFIKIKHCYNFTMTLTQVNSVIQQTFIRHTYVPGTLLGNRRQG